MGMLQISISLVVLGIFGLTLASLLFNKVKRPVQRVICGGCKYDVEGLPPDAQCPECGAGAMFRRVERLGFAPDRAAWVICACTVACSFVVPEMYERWWTDRLANAYPLMSAAVRRNHATWNGPTEWMALTLLTLVGFAVAKWCDPRRWPFVAVPASIIGAVAYPYLAWNAGIWSWNSPGTAETGVARFTLVWWPLIVPAASAVLLLTLRVRRGWLRVPATLPS